MIVCFNSPHNISIDHCCSLQSSEHLVADYHKLWRCILYDFYIYIINQIILKKYLHIHKYNYLLHFSHNSCSIYAVEVYPFLWQLQNISWTILKEKFIKLQSKMCTHKMNYVNDFIKIYLYSNKNVKPSTYSNTHTHTILMFSVIHTPFAPVLLSFQNGQTLY